MECIVGWDDGVHYPALIMRSHGDAMHPVFPWFCSLLITTQRQQCIHKSRAPLLDGAISGALYIAERTHVLLRPKSCAQFNTTQ